MITNPLEELAKEGREREERIEAAIDEQRAKLETKQTRDEVLDEALGGGFGWKAWLAFVIGVPAAFITTGVLAQLDPTFVHLGWVGALAIGGALLYWLGDRFHRAAELRWIARIPYPFDAAGYVQGLKKKRRQVRIRARVSFATPVPSHARELVKEAVVAAVESRPWMGDGTRSTATFEGDVLVVQSSEMHGRFGTTSSDPERPAHHSNRQFHQWFRLLVDRGLSAVHSRYPITAVRVSF